MTDTLQNNNNVSIQLLLGGHSFSKQIAAHLTELDAAEHITIYVPTSKSVAVPAEQYSEASAAEHLAALGSAPSAEECIVVDCATEGVVVLMALERSLHDEIEACYGGKVEYRSPMFMDDAVSDGVTLRLAHDVLYIRLYAGGRMLLAEAVAAKSDADIIYYLASIDEVYAIFNNARAHVRGDVKRLRPVAKRLFKHISCE